MNTSVRPNANARAETVHSENAPLSPDQLQKMDAYWRACNYLSVGMIYLRANPLLREPLQAGAHQAAPARTLGFGPGTVVRAGCI